MSSQLWNMTAIELARAIASREVSSREVIDAHLARIEEVNPKLNAVVRVLGDDARNAADRADQAVRNGDVLGPLHGVPITIKENIDLAGTPTTSAVAAMAEAVAPMDAPVVERMKAAGAIPMARTNLPDMGLRVTTESSLYGITRNPHHPDRTVGGSSGGEASAIASGMSPLGLGNDVGGSLRNPAHACGISSIRPTGGVVPMANAIPPEDHPISYQLMLTEGVMARAVADVALGFGVVRGAHPRDPVSFDAVLPDLGDSERVTIAVMAEPPGTPTHPEVAAGVRRVADVLAAQGHDVVEATPPDFELVCELWLAVLNSDIEVMLPLLEAVMGDDAVRFLTLARSQTPHPTVESIAMTHIERNRVMRAWSMWHQSHEFLLAPVWTQPPFEHSADIADEASALATLDMLRPVMPSNLMGTPAVVIPGGVADGSPTGVQIIGWRNSDVRCLALGAQAQSVLGVPAAIDPKW
ncbi:MAG: hypothetical protein KDB16_17040 [Acidimicrobiales bacterium]|nr:hypothetical protein [Acidimicrobiales bacterium]